MQSRPAHKRAALSTGEASSSHSSSHVAKKTRFVEPEEDPAKFSEEVESTLEDPLAKRKGRVRNEGYESDSSDDGEGVVLSRRKKAGGKGAGVGAGAEGEEEDDEEDEDMFAMGEKEETKGEEAGAKKGKEQFLRLGDIEGQEFDDGSGSGGSGDDEPLDEDDAERRKKAGMGYELSSFNMREEMEEGKFAADGTYVRSFDPHDVHDRWMDGFDEKDIKMARRRKRQQERQQEEKMKAEERDIDESGGKGELERQLLGMLKKGETVLEALQRLGTKSKKSRPANKKHAHAKTQNGNSDGAMTVDKEPKATSDIDQITHIASTLMSFGDTDIYSKTFEELVRSVRSSGRVGADWVPTSADMKYEYRWDVPGQPGEAFGPFGEDDMKTWFKAAYFGEVGEKVKVRPVGGDWGDWDDVII